MSKIGVGIVTFRRLEYLKRVVEGVKSHTTSDYVLVVAEDGGDDGSREWCEENGIRVISGQNSGVCWNKNRALFALQELGCDPIVLLEDDCIPVLDSWDWSWRIATALFGHVAYAHPKLQPWLISGAGTPIDPYVNNKATAQCSSASGVALAQVGFFDTRFKGYGVGHAEWTTRMKRGGWGFRKAINKEGREVNANLYITGGLVGDDAPTFKDKTNIARNEKLFEELKKEPIYRHPWSNEEECTRFLAEQKAAGISGSRYRVLQGNEEEISGSLHLRHLRPYGKAFRRTFTEPGSFLRTSGWLSSIALSIPAYEGEIVPWFNYTVVDLLRGRVKPEWRVYEFGAGYSTLWWSSKVASVRSVEHNAQWAALMQSLCPAHIATIDVRPADESFSEAIVDAGGTYEVIVVDGHDRPACLRKSLAYLASNGVFVIDNSDRREYREAIDELKAQGFKELQLKGPAPMTYKAETTSFLYRGENCFDF